MQYLWHIEYTLAISCPVFLVGCLLWFVNNRKTWASRIAIKYIYSMIIAFLITFPYCIVCVPQLWEEIFSNKLSNPYSYIYILTYLWMPCLWIAVESIFLFHIAQRVEQFEQPDRLIKAVILFSISPILGFIIAAIQFYYIGGWTLFDTLIIIASGVVLSTIFSYISYLMIEPMIEKKFGSSFVFDGLGRRLSVAMWILFLDTIALVMIILPGNISSSPPNIIIFKITLIFLIFSLPYSYFIKRFSKSIAFPVLALRKSEERFRDISFNIADWLWEVDENWIFTYCSRKVQDIFGRHQEELIGLTPFDLMLREEAMSAMEAYEKLKKNKEPIKDIENWKIGIDGKKICFITNAVPILDEEENLKGYRGVDKNITRNKQAEAQKEALLDNLEISNEKLKHFNRQLEDFVYIASHDLQEPLRKISAFGSILSKSLKNKLDKDQEENLNFMIDGAARLQQMVDGLLTYSRITTKTKPFEEININNVIIDLQNVELSYQIEETKGTIQIIEPLPIIFCDRSQIYQLLQNLTGNGLKYHRKDLAPKIIIRGSLVNDNMVRVEVEDNGIGIEKKYHEEVFCMFKRLHPQNIYKGAGIGLSICRKIVERHRGEIGLESIPGKGSIFWFTVPSMKQQKDKMEASVK